MFKPVLQEGLFSKSNKEVESFVDRVTKFNMLNLANPVKLDIMPYEEGDRDCPDPHYKLRLLFPSKEIMSEFWTKAY